MIFLIILCIALFATALILGIGWFYSYKRELKWKIYAEWFVNFNYHLIKKIKDVQVELNVIDHRGSFKADDEVGFAFKAIQECIDDLESFIDKNIETKNAEKEDKAEKK